MPEKKKITQEDRVWGALSYIWVFSIVVLALHKDDANIRFHANQGVLLFVASFIGIIPLIGWIASICVFVLMIIGVIKAYQGEKWELPIGAGIAKDFGEWVVKTLKI